MKLLLAVLGALGISFAAIFFRLSGVSPSTAVFFRTLYALPVLFWLARAHPTTPHIRWLSLFGGLLFGVDLLCWHAAIERIGAGLATVMANTQVIWVGLGAWLLQRERPPTRYLAVLPVLLGGVALLAGLGDRHAFGRDPLVGTALGLAGAVTYAAYLLVHRKACRGNSFPIAQLRDATIGICVMSLLAGLLLDPGFAPVPTWPAHGWLLVLALVVQVLAWLALSVALPQLGAVQGSTILLLQPTGTLIWAGLLFSEAPSQRQWLGAVLVFLGVIAVQWPRSPAVSAGKG